METWRDSAAGLPQSQCAMAEWVGAPPPGLYNRADVRHRTREGHVVIIDSHGHVTAPDSLYVYKAQITSHRGAHGRGGGLANEEDVRAALNKPVFGGTSHLEQLKEV